MQPTHLHPTSPRTSAESDPITREDVLSSEDRPEVAQLRHRLDEFYARSQEYVDFHQPNYKDQYWRPIRDHIARIIESRGSCRVLEFGAGCTGFADFLGELRSKVHFTAQDITPANKTHLERVADRVHIGDLSSLVGEFDVIFSTFVFEHVSNPRSTLTRLLASLSVSNPGSSLFIACPRYDYPGYVPPSARHYSRLRQLLLSMRVAFIRLATRISGKPRFLIHLDPAMFHMPWFPDADAIHWPSKADLRASLPRGYTLTNVPFEHRNLKQWLFAKLVLLFVRIDRTPAANNQTHKPKENSA